MAALAALYAGMDWTSADAASTARDQLANLLDAREVAAAAAGEDALFAAWQALASVALLDAATAAAHRLRTPEASGRTGAGISAVSGRDTGNRAGCAERCTASAVHADERQCAGDMNHLELQAAGQRVRFRYFYHFRAAYLSRVLGQQHLEISLDRVQQSELHQWKARGRRDSGRG